MKKLLTLFAFCLMVPAAQAADPEVFVMPAQHVLYIKGGASMEQIGPTLARLFPKVGEYVRAHGLTVAGAPLARYHMRPDGTFDIEAGTSITEANSGEGDVRYARWPSQRVAHVIHKGALDGLPAAHDMFHKWIRTQGLQIVGDLWEVYLSDPGNTPADQILTELVYPVR